MLVTCTPAGQTTEISYLGVTLTFAEAVTFGYFETDGSPWFIGPVAFPTISHAGVTGRHGAMINPSQATAHGYDSREKDAGNTSHYDASLNVMVNPPATIVPGDSLCKMISLNPDTPTLGTGGSSTVGDVMAIFTCLAEAPASGAFRPPYAGTDKTMRNRSEVNHALSPGLAKPTGPVTPLPTLDVVSLVKSPLYDCGGRNWRNKIRPQTAFGGDVYPASAFCFVGSAAAYSLTSEADANEVRNRLVQQGIDYWAVAQFCDDGFANGAGFGANGALFCILYAGYFLEDVEMLAAGEMTTVSGIPKFGEQYQFYYTDTPNSEIILPRPVENYPNGVPLFGDYEDDPLSPGLGVNWSERNLTAQADEIADGDQVGYYDANAFPSGSDYNPSPPLFRGASEHTVQDTGTYMYIAGRAHAGELFVARKLGIDQYFDAPAHFDWLERAVNDAFNMCTQQGLRNAALYVFGGSSSTALRNLLMNMYLNYHGDRATLSGASASATGATTGTLTVTTDKDRGKIKWVATTSATKPNGHQVNLGMTHIDNTPGQPHGETDFLTTSGEKTIPLTGLATGVAQYIHVTHYGEDSSIASVVTAGPITPS